MQESGVKCPGLTRAAKRSCRFPSWRFPQVRWGRLLQLHVRRGALRLQRRVPLYRSCGGLLRRLRKRDQRVRGRFIHVRGSVQQQIYAHHDFHRGGDGVPVHLQHRVCGRELLPHREKKRRGSFQPLSLALGRCDLCRRRVADRFRKMTRGTARVGFVSRS